MVREERVKYLGKSLIIRYVANHYYIQIILSGEQQRIEYIKHIVQTPREIQFLNHLEDYVKQTDNKFNDFDWWMFSKLDESLDRVYIPYYDGMANRVREFKPDFIFWLQRKNQYFIVFIDPKGTEHTEYQRKLDGYAQLFMENQKPNVSNTKGKMSMSSPFYVQMTKAKCPPGTKTEIPSRGVEIR